MIRWARQALLSTLLALTAPLVGQAQAANASAEARRIAAPVTDAARDALAADAALPPPTSTRERLERMGRLDQAVREGLKKIDFATLTPSTSQEVGRLIGEALGSIDRANMEQLASMIPAEGWFTRGQYGAAASKAAMLIVQHAADLPTRKALLPRLEPLARAGEIDGGDYAMLYDRTAIWDGGRQRYGTQMICVNGRAQPQPLEDAARVEALRAGLRIRQTYAGYVAEHAGGPCV